MPETTGLRRTASVALVTALVVLLLHTQVAQVRRVGSDSMLPTVGTGAVVVVDRLTPRLRPVHRGDLVVFASPDDGADSLKRAVATAGQTVELRDAVLHVDGRAVDEPQVDLSRIDGTWFGPVTVAPGSVFVLGDARSGSVDSRVYGSVPLRDVRGRVLLVVDDGRG